jgi:intracellular multiplication protein IcmK
MRLTLLSGFMGAALFVSSLAQAQGLQRVGAEPVAAPAPTFSAQMPPSKAPANVVNPLAGAPMPTPMPSGMAPRADLVQESLNQVAPLTAEEILRLRVEFNARANAGSQPLSSTAKPVMRTTKFDMGPGAVPEVIRVMQTEGSTVSFMDAAGRPWEVAGADNFNPSGLDIGRAGKYALVVSSKVPETTGNISVRLAGLVSPVTLKVISGGSGLREVDYAVDIQIPRYLPGVPAPIGGVSNQLDLGVGDLMDYLMKTPPQGSRQLTVEGLPGALAWQSAGGRIFVRTEQLVFSPNPLRRQSSFDGMTVYEVPVAPYVLVSTTEGRILNVKISGYSLVQEAKK